MSEHFNQAEITEILKISRQVYEEMDKKRMERAKNIRLSCTRQLLKNYDALKVHETEIVTEIDNYLAEEFSKADLAIRSLIGYKARTKKMMEIVDIEFDVFKKYVGGRDDEGHRQAFALEHMFMTPKKWTAVEIADYFNVTERTIQRDKRNAIEEYSVYLFGITGLLELVC